MRAGLVALFANYGARARIAYVEASGQETFARNRARKLPVRRCMESITGSRGPRTGDTSFRLWPAAAVSRLIQLTAKKFT
jgi:hypothetical protein